MQQSWVIQRLGESALPTTEEGLIPTASDVVGDPKLLARIQEALVEILEDMDKAYHELSIPYSVYGGTMTGAIYYKGFIP